jgi:hypothetical protein
LADAARGSRVVLVCPIPRYVRTKCCDDPSHITNIGGEDYEEELMDFQEQHRKILGGWGSTQGLNFEIFDPTTVVNPTEPGLGNRLTSGGSSLWASNDGVHLSPDGYRDVAMGLADLVRGEDYPESTDGSSSTISENQKRKRPDSVITVPEHQRNRNKTPAPTMAEWVTGQRVASRWKNRLHISSDKNNRGTNPFRGGGWGGSRRGNGRGWRGESFWSRGVKRKLCK